MGSLTALLGCGLCFPRGCRAFRLRDRSFTLARSSVQQRLPHARLKMVGTLGHVKREPRAECLSSTRAQVKSDFSRLRADHADSRKSVVVLNEAAKGSGAVEICGAVELSSMCAPRSRNTSSPFGIGFRHESIMRGCFRGRRLRILCMYVWMHACMYVSLAVLQSTHRPEAFAAQPPKSRNLEAAHSAWHRFSDVSLRPRSNELLASVGHLVLRAVLLPDVMWLVPIVGGVELASTFAIFHVKIHTRER